MRALACCLMALTLGALAQAPQPASQFSVVSIKRVSGQDGEGSMHMIGALDPAHWRTQAMGVSEMISVAYGLKANSYFRIVGLPDWAESQEFTIQAVMPPGTRRSQIPAMVKAMLAGRFQLVAHIENRPMDAAALTVAPGGPKLQRDLDCENADPLPTGFNLDTTAPPDCGNWQLVPQHKGSDVFYVYTFHGVTMAQLAQFAETQKLPCIDKTGLPGAYDFTLSLPMISGAAMRSLGKEEQDALSERVGRDRLAAYTQQLGLVLSNPQKLPVPIVVVEHVAQPTPD